MDQIWSPYEGCTHFRWHDVEDNIMNEPQSGTTTFGLSSRYSNPMPRVSTGIFCLGNCDLVVCISSFRTVVGGRNVLAIYRSLKLY